MSYMFQSRVRLNDEEQLQISMTVTICKAKVSTEGNAKGKGSTWLVEINWKEYYMEILTISKSSHAGDLGNKFFFFLSCCIIMLSYSINCNIFVFKNCRPRKVVCEMMLILGGKYYFCALILDNMTCRASSTYLSFWMKRNVE
jgi:hypothetical protein